MSGGPLLIIGQNDPSDRQGISREYAAVRALGLRAGILVTSQLNGPPIQNSLVASQLESSMDLLKPVCVRVGFVGNVETVLNIAQSLDRWKPETVVLDPIGLGDPDEVAEEMVDALRDQLLPRTSLVTPSWRESGTLIRAYPRGLEDLDRISISFRRLGVENLLIDTSDLPGDPVVAVLITGAESRRFQIPSAVNREIPRGMTSALIAARLAQGNSIDSACEIVFSGQEHGMGSGTPGTKPERLPQV